MQYRKYHVSECLEASTKLYRSEPILSSDTGAKKYKRTVCSDDGRIELLELILGRDP